MTPVVEFFVPYECGGRLFLPKSLSSPFVDCSTSKPYFPDVSSRYSSSPLSWEDAPALSPLVNNLSPRLLVYSASHCLRSWSCGWYSSKMASFAVIPRDIRCARSSLTASCLNRTYSSAFQNKSFMSGFISVRDSTRQM